jgi:DNA-binding CsgD family transcriptional regulator
VPAHLRSTLRDLALSYANEIVAAVRSANLGELFEPDADDAQGLGERVSRGAAGWGAKYGLSDAEVDILRWAALGETHAEIARRRGTSVHTIKTQSVRLLRRTRDGSLESAANRLLRDLVGRSPRPVATRPRPTGGVGGGGPLQSRIEQLRLLVAQPSDDSVRYAMGAIVRELKSHPETYGASAVSVAAVAIGEDLPGLYRFASVAEQWSAREVSTLLSGKALSWSHLVALARVESRPVRERFLRRVQRERLTLRELVAALGAAGLA